MAGNKAGGVAAARMNKIKYGPDFYKRIGAKGGAASNTGGFANNRELASLAGKIGGSRSVEIRRAKRDALKHDEWAPDN